MEKQKATVITVFKNIGHQKEYEIRRILSEYMKKVQRILENHGYEVGIEDKPRIFNVQKGLRWYATHLLDFVWYDGDYGQNPVTGAIGKGYIRDFIEQQRLHKRPEKIVCISDVPTWTSGLTSLPINYQHNVTWLSYFDPRTDNMLDDNQVAGFILENHTKF